MIEVTQRIRFKKPQSVETIAKYVRNRDLNALWDDDLAEGHENLVDSEHYDYDSVGFYNRDTGKYEQIK